MPLFRFILGAISDLSFCIPTLFSYSYCHLGFHFHLMKCISCVISHEPYYERVCFPSPFCLVAFNLQSFTALYRQTHFPIMPCLITALLSCISHGSSALPFFRPILKAIINKHPTTNVPLHCLAHVRPTPSLPSFLHRFNLLYSFWACTAHTDFLPISYPTRSRNCSNGWERVEFICAFSFDA